MDANVVSDAELQSFLDDISKPTGEDDVFGALDEIGTNSHRIINELQGPILAKAAQAVDRMQNSLTVQEAEVKMFTQKLAQMNKEVQRDNEDSVFSSKTKVKLEAQIIQTRKQAIVCADTSTKLQYIRELENKINNIESDEQMTERQQ